MRPIRAQVGGSFSASSSASQQTTGSSSRQHIIGESSQPDAAASSQVCRHNWRNFNYTFRRIDKGMSHNNRAPATTDVQETK
jgi:hypothetical protein